MSLICGALKWLKDSDERDKIEAEKILKGERSSCVEQNKTEKSNNNNTNEPDWMRDFEEKQAAKETATKLKEAVERRLRRKERMKKLKELYGPSAK
ncbi:ATP-dependent DNA helicase DDX11-like [Dysidea avara]|uniref:ATP-dependent DNA helicase DDX11-like n=1 Tax=Dysidea avara TaxID=196820 RepID=UPI003319A333